MKYTVKNLPTYFSFLIEDDLYMCDVDLHTSSVMWLEDSGLIRGISYRNSDVVNCLNSGSWKIKNIIK